MHWWHRLRYWSRHPGNWYANKKKNFWSGVSILIWHADSSSEPYRVRVNLILLLFIATLVCGIPLINVAISIQDYLNSESEVQSTQKRLLLIYRSRYNLLQKKKHLASIKTQLKQLGKLSYVSDHSILERLLAQNEHQLSIFSESENYSPTQNRYDLDLLQNLHKRSHQLLKWQAYHSLHFLWHRISLHHYMPRGRPLPAGAGMITSGFGKRENPTADTAIYEFHTGVDFGDAPGTPLIATGPGYVFKAVNDPSVGYGNHVRIHHGFGITTLYAHCQSLAVEEGQFVRRGQVVGYLGKTGRVTGNHIHYEVQFGNEPAVNPMEYIQLK